MNGITIIDDSNTNNCNQSPNEDSSDVIVKGTIQISLEELLEGEPYKTKELAPVLPEEEFPTVEGCGISPIPIIDYRIHNNLKQIQGGTPTERYHLNLNQYEAAFYANNPSASNPFVTIEDIGGLNLDNYYTKLELQTSGQSEVHWDNITNVPDLTVLWQNIQGDQNIVNISGFNNDAGYITEVYWDQILGNQSDIEVGNFANTIGYITLADIPVIDLSNYYTKTELQTPGDAMIHWDNITNVPDLSVLWENILGNQSSVEVGGFSNSIGYITLDDLPPYPIIPTNTSSFTNDGEDGINPFITALDLPDLSTYIQQGDNVSDLTNDAGYITGVTWTQIGGLQTSIEVGNFSNSIGYITIADIPLQIQTDWDATSGLGQILNKPNLATVATSGNYNDLINLPSLPDLTGYATEAWVISQGYLTSISSSWNVNNGNLTVQSNTMNLDGRYMLRSNTITSGYGITASANFTNPVNIEIDTEILDDRYLRKDINDSNDTFTLSLGNLIANTATINSTLTLPSVAVGATNADFLTLNPITGAVEKTALDPSGFGFNIANNAGTNQFTVPIGGQLRLNATGDASVAFNPATNTITINSSGGSTGGGVDSWNARTGAVVPEAGDYTTTLVTEGTNQYFTQARVRSTTLAGMTFGISGEINTSDTILQAFPKLQNQINQLVPTSRTITVNGTAGNITVSGGTQSLLSNRTWTVNLSTIGSAGTYPKVTTDAYGRVISGTSLVNSDLPPAAFQNLTVQPLTDFGGLSISNGNSVYLNAIRTAGTYADAQTMLDGITGNGSGLFYYSHTTGATGFSSAVGAGFASWRYSGATAKSGFLIETSTTANDEIYYATIAGDGQLRSWQTFASRDWVLSQIPTVPTNYVTTNTTQSGLSGIKNWTNYHGWSTTANPGVAINTTHIGGNPTSGQYIRAGRFNTAAQSFILRGYQINGIQLSLDEGGINIPSGSSNTSPGYFIDGNVILSSASNYSLISAPTTSGIIYLYPNGRASATGRSIFTPTDVTLSALSGSGTQMVVANASGVLSRQAIPAVGVTAVNAGNGMSFSSITSTGSVTLGTPGTLSPTTTNSVSATSHTHALADTVLQSHGNSLSGDLNSVSWNGTQSVGTAANATLALNYPVAGGGGTLLNLHNGTYVTQLFHNRNGSYLGWRARTSASAWTSWEQIYHTGNFNPSNYVTTNTSQTGLSGNKTWTGMHTWDSGTTLIYTATNDAIGSYMNARPDPSVSTEARMYMYAKNSAGTNRDYKQAWYDGSAYMNLDVTSTTFDFTRRMKSITSTGWVDIGSVSSSYVHYNTDRPGHYFYKELVNQTQIRIAGGGSDTFSDANGQLALKSTGNSPYISFHESSGARLGYIQMLTSGVRINGNGNGVRLMDLSGTGTQMVTVNANGDLARQAIPAVGVTSVGSGTGLSGGTITSTGTLSISAAYSPNTSTSLGTADLNATTTPGFYHQTSNANATSARNYPTTSAGNLQVYRDAGVTQRYNVYNTGATYVRNYYSSSWTAWTRVDYRSHSHTWESLTGTIGTIPGAGASGSWTSLNISGSKGGYSGINFTDAGKWMMVGNSNGYFGIHNGSGWDFAFVNGTLNTGSVPWARLTGEVSVSAGNGLSGGGALSASRTITLGTPGTITGSSTNSVSTSSHTHALTLVSADITGALGFTPVTTARTITMVGGNGITSSAGAQSLAGNRSWTISLTPINAGSGTVGAVRYNGTSRTAGSWYGGSTNPVSSTRLNFDGIIHAYDTQVYGSSDEKLKENIQLIANPIEKLKQIGGYSFTWKEGHESYKGHDYGLIAQEVEKILPEIVIERGGIKAIKTGNQIIGLLVESVKELNRRLEVIENGIS